MSINLVSITGNLTRDPELRATASGTQVLGFGVAVNERRKNPHTGEWEDYPNFVDCTMFGNRAEAISRYLRKGGKVAVEGKLRYSSWEAKDGTKRSELEVIVDEIELMQQQQQQGGYQQPAYAQPAPQAYQQPQPAYQPPQQAYQQPQQAYQPATQPQAYRPQPVPQQAPQAYQQPQPAQQPLPMQQPQPVQQQAQPQPAQQQAAQPPVVDVYDEDIPF